jgi:hypothetical protein
MRQGATGRTHHVIVRCKLELVLRANILNVIVNVINCWRYTDCCLSRLYCTYRNTRAIVSLRKAVGIENRKIQSLFYYKKRTAAVNSVVQRDWFVCLCSLSCCYTEWYSVCSKLISYSIYPKSIPYKKARAIVNSVVQRNWSVRLCSQLFTYLKKNRIWIELPLSFCYT